MRVSSQITSATLRKSQFNRPTQYHFGQNWVQRNKKPIGNTLSAITLLGFLVTGLLEYGGEIPQSHKDGLMGEVLMTAYGLLSGLCFWQANKKEKAEA